MIALDEEWLDSLRFTAIGGIKINGLQGSGSEKVVFRGDARRLRSRRSDIQVRSLHQGDPPFVMDLPTMIRTA